MTANLEICYEIISQLFFLGSMAAFSYCYYILAKAFLRRRRGAWLVGAAYFAVMELLYYIPPVISNFSAYLLGALAGFLAMRFLERENLEQKIFLAVTFFSLRWLAAVAQTILSQIVFSSLRRLFGISGDGWLGFIVFTIESVLDGLMLFAFVLCAVRVIQKAYVHKREGMTWRELALLLIPSLSGVAGYAVLRAYKDIYQRDTGKDLYRSYGPYSWLCLAYYAVSFLSILAAIVLFQNLKSRQEEEKRNRLLLGQLEEVQRHISEVERLYSDIRSLRHDMDNHILTLEHLYSRGKHEAAKSYMEEMKKRLHEGPPEFHSGNPVTDVILSEREKEARERGIAFQCAFHYPQGGNISAVDISIILNNALANALAGAEKSSEPTVQVASYRQNNAYLIEIVNSFSGEILWNEESGLPESPRPGHGLGLSNIRRVAQKYFGDIDIAVDGQSFKLNILLMTE